MSIGQIETLIGLSNVRDYGARGDGQTNDTPRIHDAILALPPAGGTIVFPAGNYYLGQNVTFQGRNNVTFWLMAGASFSGPGTLPANAGTNRVFDVSFVAGSFPPSGPAGGGLAGNYPNPTIADGAVGDAQVAAAGLSNGSLGPSVQRANLLVNGGQEIKQRPTTSISANGAILLDGWALQLNNGGGASTCTVTQIASTIGHPGQSGQLAYVHNGGNAQHQSFKIEPVANRLGGVLSLSVLVKSTVVGTVRPYVWDSVNGFRFGAYNAAASPAAGEVLTIANVPIAAAATDVRAGIWVDTASCTVEVNDLCLVEGAVAAAYTAPAAAEDLARCLRYYQRWQLGSAFVLGPGAAISGTSGWVMVPLQARMGGSPTLTLSAQTDFSVLSAAAGGGATGLTALTANQIGANGAGPLLLTFTVAAGLAAGQFVWLAHANAASWLAAEWAP